MPEEKGTSKLPPSNATVVNILDYLQEEKDLLIAELKNYDATLNTNDMTVQEMDAFVCRKRLYDVERYLKVIRRLSGLK